MRLVRVTAAATLGLGLLAGCSDGGTASQTLPSASSSPASTSAALLPLGPPDMPMPDEAREQTAAGAEAFLRYYIDILNYTQSELTPTYVRDLSEQCATCNAFADGVDGYVHQGYRLSGGRIALTSASNAVLKGDEAEFSVALTQQPLTVTNEAADVVETAPESSFPASGASLSWDAAQSSWLMTEITIQ
jgi:hypothetical protein